MRVSSTTKFLSLSLAALLVAIPLHVQAEDVPMNAVVTTPGCVIIVQQNGTLNLRRNGRRLDSRGNVATAGIAQIRTFGPDTISVEAPTTWASSPIAGNGNTRFRTRYRGNRVSGANGSFGWRNGTRSVRMPNGPSVTDIRVRMIADHQSGPFPAGDYTAYATLRCE